MILILEILMLVTGIKMLLTGRGFSKKVPSDKRFRYLGGFLVVEFPLMLVSCFLLGVIWMLNHPGSSVDKMTSDIGWVSIVIEVGLTLIWAITWAIWEKSITKKLQAPRADAFPLAPSAPADAPPVMAEKTFGTPIEQRTQR